MTPDWDCPWNGTDVVSCIEGSCISCDWQRQHDASSGWDDPNFCESWEYDEVWLRRYGQQDGVERETLTCSFGELPCNTINLK